MPEEIQHPINAFPEYVQKIIYHYCECKGYKEEWFIQGFLAAASTAIGRSITLNTGNYTAIASIWAIILGKRGFNKSEPLKDAFAPVRRYQQQLIKQYRDELEEIAQYRVDNPKSKVGDPKPAKKVVISDITPEKLVMTLADNPKGCGMVYDEIAGFVNRFNRYSSGGDEQMFLSLFNGDSIVRDRMSGVDAYAPHSYLSIIGTTQPSVLQKVFSERSESGFFDRWLISQPDEVLKQYPNQFGVNPVEYGKYESILNTLLSIEFEDDTEQMDYSLEAYEIVNKYQREIIDIENTTDSDDLRGILAKMEIYLHKFALILQVIEFGISREWKDLAYVSKESATGAVILARYFVEEAKKVRVTKPDERLKDKWLDVFNALPEHGQQFDRKHFIKVCGVHGFQTRAADKFLKEHGLRDEQSLLFKIKHGVYTKNLF